MLQVDAGVNMMTNRWPHDEYPANQLSVLEKSVVLSIFLWEMAACK